MSRKVDPITLSVVQGTLHSTTKEMTVTMERTCRSPILTLAHDYSNTICDWVPRIVVQGDDLPAQLGGVALIVQGVVDYLEDDVHPGDVIYCNDPEMGNTHLAEMNMFKPVFYEGEIVFWVVQRSHMNDTGGAGAGTMYPDAEEIYAEGFRFPPIKLYEKGVPNKAMFDIILKNVRVPRAQLGDMRGQYATVSIAEKRLLALLQKYGKQTVKDAIEELLDRSERMMRREIEKMPDGVYHGSATLEDPGKGIGDCEVKATVTIRGDRMKIQLASRTQVPSYVNMYPAFTLSAMYYGILYYLEDARLPHNAGSYRPIEMDFGPQGTMLNARIPAACAYSPNLDNIRDAICEALSQALPERATGGFNHGPGLIFYGRDPRRDEPYVYLCIEHILGGGGARAGKMDGWHCTGIACAGGAITSANMELLEYDKPLHVHRYQMRTDSGCAGRWRGGLGAVMEVELVDHDCILTNWGEGYKYPAPSLMGARSKFLDRKVSLHVWLKEDGTGEVIPANSTVRLPAGTRIVSYIGGGGGVGDPFERDPRRVREDVQNELVSLEAAREEYGVILDPQTLEIDAQATERARSAGRRVVGAS